MATRHTTLGIVDPARGREAYQWHRGFAGASEAVYGRPWREYERFADRGQLVAALDENDDFLGLCYFFRASGRGSAWELGGMMVSQRERGRGIGGLLGRYALGHVLFEEDPLARNESIIARVIAQNADPRGMLSATVDAQPAFHKTAGAMNVAADELKGVAAGKDGRIKGDQFAFDAAVALVGLTHWAESFDGTLKDGSAVTLRFRPGVSLALWARAFRDMARGGERR